MPKAPHTQPGLSIGALSRRTKCRSETIRYYERIGLLPPPPRSRAGHRVYALADVERVAFVRRCRDLGFSLFDIRGLLSLANDGSQACREVRQMTLAHASRIRGRIRTLDRIARDLERAAAQCGGNSARGCAIIDTWSAVER